MRVNSTMSRGVVSSQQAAEGRVVAAERPVGGDAGVGARSKHRAIHHSLILSSENIELKSQHLLTICLGLLRSERSGTIHVPRVCGLGGGPKRRRAAVARSIKDLITRSPILPSHHPSPILELHPRPAIRI